MGEEGDEAVVGTAAKDVVSSWNEAAQKVREVLEVLAPPGELTIHDAFKGQHVVADVLPAIAEIEISRALESMAGAPILRGEIEGIDTGKPENIIVGVLRIARNEEVLKAICRCFEVAHPHVVDAAFENAKETGRKTERDPLYLFPLEELVAGLLPFFARFASRIAELFEEMTGESTEDH